MRAMATQIVDVEFSILSVVAFPRVARVGVVKRQFFVCMITSCNDLGAILRVLFPQIKEWFSFGIIRLLPDMNITLVLSFIEIVRFLQVN